jgi:hypothetical protein
MAKAARLINQTIIIIRIKQDLFLWGLTPEHFNLVPELQALPFCTQYRRLYCSWCLVWGRIQNVV